MNTWTSLPHLVADSGKGTSWLQEQPVKEGVWATHENDSQHCMFNDSVYWIVDIGLVCFMDIKISAHGSLCLILHLSFHSCTFTYTAVLP